MTHGYEAAMTVLYLVSTTLDFIFIPLITVSLVILYSYHHRLYFENRSIYCIIANLFIVFICLVPTRFINILFYFDIISIDNTYDTNTFFEIFKFGICFPGILNCLLLNMLLYFKYLKRILPKANIKLVSSPKNVSHIVKPVNNMQQDKTPTTQSLHPLHGSHTLDNSNGTMSRNKPHSCSTETTFKYISKEANTSTNTSTNTNTNTNSTKSNLPKIRVTFGVDGEVDATKDKNDNLSNVNKSNSNTSVDIVIAPENTPPTNVSRSVTPFAGLTRPAHSSPSPPLTPTPTATPTPTPTLSSNGATATAKAKARTRARAKARGRTRTRTRAQTATLTAVTLSNNTSSNNTHSRNDRSKSPNSQSSRSRMSQSRSLSQSRSPSRCSSRYSNNGCTSMSLVSVYDPQPVIKMTNISDGNDNGDANDIGSDKKYNTSSVSWNSSLNIMSISNGIISMSVVFGWIVEVTIFLIINLDVYLQTTLTAFTFWAFIWRLCQYCALILLYWASLVLLFKKGQILSFDDAWKIKDEFHRIGIAVTALAGVLVVITITIVCMHSSRVSIFNSSQLETRVQSELNWYHVILDIIASSFCGVIIYTQVLWVHQVNKLQYNNNNNNGSDSNKTSIAKLWNIWHKYNFGRGQGDENDENEISDIDVSILGRLQNQRCNSGTSSLGGELGLGLGLGLAQNFKVNDVYQDKEKGTENSKNQENRSNKKDRYRIKYVKNMKPNAKKGKDYRKTRGQKRNQVDNQSSIGKQSKKDQVSTSDPDLVQENSKQQQIKITKLWHLFDGNRCSEFGISALKYEFRGFMNHCLRELCVENLLFFVNTVQFLQFLIKNDYFQFNNLNDEKYYNLIRPLKPHFCVGKYVKDTSIIKILKYQFTQLEKIEKEMLEQEKKENNSANAGDVDEVHVHTETDKDPNQDKVFMKASIKVNRVNKVNQVNTDNGIGSKSIANLNARRSRIRSRHDTLSVDGIVLNLKDGVSSIGSVGSTESDGNISMANKIMPSPTLSDTSTMDCIETMNSIDLYKYPDHHDEQSSDHDNDNTKQEKNYDVFIGFYCALYQIYIKRDVAMLEVNISDELRTKWARNIAIINNKMITNMSKSTTFGNIESKSGISDTNPITNDAFALPCAIQSGFEKPFNKSGTRMKNIVITKKMFEESIWSNIKDTALVACDLLRASFARYISKKQKSMAKLTTIKINIDAV